MPLLSIFNVGNLAMFKSIRFALLAISPYFVKKTFNGVYQL